MYFWLHTCGGLSADVKFQKLGHFDKGAWFLVYLHSVVVFPSYIVKLVIKTHNKFIFLIASLPQRNIKCLYKMSISLYPSITYFSELPNTFTTVRLMLSQQRCVWFAPRSSIGRSGSGNTDLQLFQSEPNSTMLWLDYLQWPFWLCWHDGISLVSTYEPHPSLCYHVNNEPKTLLCYAHHHQPVCAIKHKKLQCPSLAPVVKAEEELWLAALVTDFDAGLFLHLSKWKSAKQQ